MIDLQEEKLCHDQGTDVIINSTHHTDDSLLQQPREDVIGTLTASCLLHNDRDQAEISSCRKRVHLEEEVFTGLIIAG